MNFHSRNVEEDVNINLTPLIDVVFLLLIFFMVSTTFDTTSKLKINLPEANQDQGLGVQLVEACLKEAGELGITTIFCLTYKPALFEKFGFAQVDKMELPRKVWTECYRCPKFPDCDEVALIYNLEA